jgi:hypothetical protein
MIYSYYIWITIFAIIAYVIVVDPNGPRLIDLIGKVIKLNFERIYWIIRLHPKNPVTNFLMKRKYDNLAKELQKEFQERG